MRFDGYAVIIIGDPKIQLTVFLKNTSGYNSGIKFEAIESAQRAGNFFPAQISDAKRMYAVLEEILHVQLFADVQFGNINTSCKIVRRYKIKDVSVKRENTLVGLNSFMTMIERYIIGMPIV